MTAIGQTANLPEGQKTLVSFFSMDVASTAIAALKPQFHFHRWKPKSLRLQFFFVEGTLVKQFLQFLLGDEGGLENNQQVQMKLWLDSASAQAFFNRLGPGRAKHLKQ